MGRCLPGVTDGFRAVPGLDSHVASSLVVSPHPASWAMQCPWVVHHREVLVCSHLQSKHLLPATLQMLGGAPPGGHCGWAGQRQWQRSPEVMEALLPWPGGVQSSGRRGGSWPGVLGAGAQWVWRPVREPCSGEPFSPGPSVLLPCAQSLSSGCLGQPFSSSGSLWP